MYELFSKYYNESDVKKIIDGLSVKRKSTFRVNFLKSDVESVKNILAQNNINYEILSNIKANNLNDESCIEIHNNKLNLTNNIENSIENNTENIESNDSINELDVKIDVLQNLNYNIEKAGIFIIDSADEKSVEAFPLYENGEIYFQSISSMLPVFMLEPNSGENILDMCAAPGGKTTMIQSITGNSVNLTAVELHYDRFKKLEYNVKKQEANVYLINKNAMDLDDFLKFDKILLDAPCSGSGILDLNVENHNFSDKLIEKCVKTQKNLIKKAHKLLKKSGTLIYSTCSLLNVENEEIVAFAEKLGFKKEKTIKVFPSELYEGFYIGRLVRG